jgi:hypothetical protein
MFEEQEEEKTFHNDAFIDNNDYIPYPYFFAKLKKSFCRYHKWDVYKIENISNINKNRYQILKDN